MTDTAKQIGQQLTSGVDKWQGYHRDIDAEVIVPFLLAKRQVGELVGRMISDADARDAAVITPSLRDLNAHRDAMRDLREALIKLGVLGL